jgi:hypothetical protein
MKGQEEPGPLRNILRANMTGIELTAGTPCFLHFLALPLSRDASDLRHVN